MIIKVPIYVEIEKVSNQEILPDVVGILHDSFTMFLRKEDFSVRMTKSTITTLDKLVGGFKIINKEKALEYLRTRK